MLEKSFLALIFPQGKDQGRDSLALFFLHVVNNAGIKQTQGSKAEPKQSQHVLHCLGIRVNSKHFQQHPACMGFVQDKHLNNLFHQ